MISDVDMLCKLGKIKYQLMKTDPLRFFVRAFVALSLIHISWGVAEDSRYNGAAFDGNVDTTTEFGDLPQKGQYIIYDLGQVRDISKLAMFCQDSAVNYIRDADILISNDLENWTKVVTIGDGVENKGDANIICGDSDAGYKASSKYPNKVYVEGQIDTTKARYVKILMTASNLSLIHICFYVYSSNF